jgi:hypothetical protein
MSKSNLEALRKASLVTLDEIKQAEENFRQSGIDISDPDECQELAEIIARIERKLAQNIKEPNPFL